ncbi:MAG: histidine kinase [Acetobacteraceae bacterium]|nr:histidine kinase [Acetobacteraceae bacterium]
MHGWLSARLSLRTRLLIAMALALAACLLVGGTVAWLGTARSVQGELRAALDVVRRSTEAAVAAAGGTHPDPGGLLEALRGNRHLRATLLGPAGTPLGAPVVPPEQAQGLPMPTAFVRLLSAGLPDAVRVPLGGADAPVLLLQPEPANEVREAWDDLVLALSTLGLFAGLMMLWVCRAVAVALRPLEALSIACGRIGEGDFAALHLPRRPGTPEVARLCDGFNRMAERLAEAEARDRSLREQLMTLRDSERAAIARDLHDEIGPYLFAIGVDAANARRLATRLAPAEAGAVAEAARNIAEAAAHAQRGVRSLLGRLRPAAPVELGLGAALEELLDFWRRRRPDVTWELTLAPGSEAGLGRATAEAGYRLVQEALGNAVRHGRPRHVRVIVGRRDDCLLIEVADDGGGATEPRCGTDGFGLRGMAERVESMGGCFSWSNEPQHGVTVRANLPVNQGLAEAVP